MKYTLACLTLLATVSWRLPADDAGELWYPVPPDRKHDTVVTAPLILEQGFLRTGSLFSFYAHNRIFDESGAVAFPDETTAVQSYSLRASADYGVADWLQIGCTLPARYLIVTGSVYNRSLKSNEKLDHSAVGIDDISAWIRIRMIEETPFLPSTVLSGCVYVPTGRKDPYPEQPPFSDTGWENWYYTYSYPLGSGAYSISFDADFKKIIYPFAIKANIDFRYPFPGEKRHFNGLQWSDPLPFRDGASITVFAKPSFLLNSWIAIEGGLRAYWSFAGSIGNASTGTGFDGLLTELSSWFVDGDFTIHIQLGSVRISSGFVLPFAGRLAIADPLVAFCIQSVF